MKFNVTRPGVLHWENGVLTVSGWDFDTDPPSQMTDVQFTPQQRCDMIRDILLYIAEGQSITLVSVESVYEATKALQKASKP